jgi:hypothetical protein
MQPEELKQLSKPRIFGVKITQDGNKCYCISVKHTGRFCLSDYDALEFEVASAKLVKRK